MKSGRVFNPCDLKDHLSEEQILLLAVRMAECIEHGYGYVAITITNHHPNKILLHKEEKLPLPKRVT